MDSRRLEERLDYVFGDRELLDQALTHKSYAHENKTANNERLEFMGDAVLQLVISEELMGRFPKMLEGMLSKFRAVLVSEGGLCKVAEEIRLGEYLFLGKGEEQGGGREKPSLLANAMEALLAAVYMDSREKEGIQGAKRVILALFGPQIEENLSSFASEDFKTDLQMWVQKRKLGEITYEVTDEEGPSHEKTFFVQLLIGGVKKGEGQGKSKKLAEQMAAQSALDSYKSENERD